MKKAKQGGTSPRDVSPRPQPADPTISRDGSSSRKGRPRELDHAVQRYADLYDLAPTGYVSFDRSGRIEEINLTAAHLFGIPRERLIGMPFMVFVVRDDTSLFLHHLLRCRSSDTRVETELRLKNVKRKIIHAYLSSTPVSASVHNGALLYQTAIVDLTQRKAAEASLREKEAELEQITTQTPFMLARCRRDLRYRYVSHAYAKMLGCKPEEIAGKPIVEFMGKEGLATIRPYVERVLAGETVTYEANIPFGNHQQHFLRGVYVPDENEQGEVVGWIASLIDVTEQKQAEQAVAEAARQERALYQFVRRQHEAKTPREIYDAALDVILSTLHCDRASILLFDAGHVMRFVAWRGLSQRYRKAVEGHSPWKSDVTDPQPVCITDVDCARIPNYLKSTIKAEGIHAAAFIPLLAEEKLIGKFMIYHDSPHVFSEKELTLALAIARQLALGIERERAEAALRESEENLRAIFNQSNAGIASCDLEGRFLFANQKFSEMLGYASSELADKTIFTITHRDDVDLTKRCFRQMVKKKQPIEIEKRYICKDRSFIWVNVCDTPLLSAEGKPVSAVAVAIDITQRKNAEAALQKSKELLEKLVEQRTKALRVTNAELKNEIERRKGLEGEILGISDREQQRLGQELHDGLCQHLTAVAFMARSVGLRLKNHRVIDAADIEKIAELVNAAATDTRNLSQALHRFDVDAAAFVDALHDLVDREIWKTPCRLEVKPSFHIDDDATAAQLYRIAREAVINANKHAQAREIVIKLERSREGTVLSVIDDGVGFNNEPKLKTGLGCHIMDYRARLIGGRLKIDLPKRGGTCVSCYLPNGAVQPRKELKRKNAEARRFPSTSKLAKALAIVI